MDDMGWGILKSLLKGCTVIMLGIATVAALVWYLIDKFI